MKPYRKAVAAIILGQDGKVLVGERSDAADHWQLPQGGIDEGETPEQAVAREVHEEVGVRNLKIVTRTQSYIQTDWPPEVLAEFATRKKKKKYRGQEHIYFVLEGAHIVPEKLTPTEEFSKFRWVTFETLLKEVTPWRQEAYKTAFVELKLSF